MCFTSWLIKQMPNKIISISIIKHSQSFLSWNIIKTFSCCNIVPTLYFVKISPKFLEGNIHPAIASPSERFLVSVLTPAALDPMASPSTGPGCHGLWSAWNLKGSQRKPGLHDCEYPSIGHKLRVSFLRVGRRTKSGQYLRTRFYVHSPIKSLCFSDNACSGFSSVLGTVFQITQLH